MSFWEFDNIRAVLGGTWLARPASARALDPHPAVSTDSRAIKPGQIFVAIRGDRTDGHLHVGDAARAGAALAIVEEAPDSPVAPNCGVLRVAGTRRALLKLGAAYRKTLDGTRVIAVTGSNGKTTTSRLIDAILSRGLRGSASVKSFNNHVGVPLTIFGARPGDQYLVCEVGTNAPGEVDELARVVGADVAVITGVGREHLEGLSSLRGVAEEEASQLASLRQGGLAVVNADAPFLLEVIGERFRAGPDGRAPFNLVTFGTGSGADLRAGDVRQDGSGVTFTVNERGAFRVPLLGRHNALNATAAIAVGRRFGVENGALQAGLDAVRGAEMRLESSTIHGVRVINDAYNANPDSMAAAIITLNDIGGGRRVAVLGDMLELGEHSDGAHEDLIREIRGRGAADLLVLVGPNMARAARAVGDTGAIVIADTDDVHVAAAADVLRPGDTVLLKGSRRMRLERVAAALRARDSLTGPG